MEAEYKNDKSISTSSQLKTYRDVRVLWPPECPDDILDYVIMQVKRLMGEFDIDKDGLEIAMRLKRIMDEMYEPYWHVICGRNFGSNAVHESNRFIFLTLDRASFLVYKSK